MRIYSEHNLIGKKLGLVNKVEKRGFWGTVLSFFDSITHNLTLKITVPAYIYLKTLSYCESIEKRHEDSKFRFGCDHLVGALLINFIEKYEVKKAMNYVSRFKVTDNSCVIIDHLSNKRIVQERSQLKNVWMNLDEDYIYKCELILLEMDEIYGHDMNVPDLILNIWTKFVQENRNEPQSKVVNRILRIIQENERLIDD